MNKKDFLRFYLPNDTSFFDTSKAQLKIEKVIHKERPRFSIIIPSFNRKKYLKFVLSNFFNQNYPKSQYEIIVIDDGSKDKTFESIKNLKPTCNFKYFYWPRKKIPLKKEFKKWAKFYNRAGPARNIGIKHAHGEIILFNDSDILVAKNCLKKHEHRHQEYDNIIVRGIRRYLTKQFRASLKNISQTKILRPNSYPEKPKEEQLLHYRLYNLSEKGWHRVVTSNLSIRKKYLEKVKGFSPDFIFWGFEDVDLGYRLKKLDLKLIWDKEITVYHLPHAKETDSKLKELAILWLGANILYKKYADEEIYRIYRDVIIRRLNKLIC